VVRARHAYRSAERARSPGYSLVVGRYDHLRKVLCFTGTLENVLEDGFAGEKSERFAWKSRRGKPGGDYAQNSLWHVRF
jgi:hypothetical protein